MYVNYSNPNAAARFGSGGRVAAAPSALVRLRLPIVVQRTARGGPIARFGDSRRRFAFAGRPGARGLGGVLEDAQALLRAAGYAGATCRTESVSCPQCPGGSYTQDICSAPGYSGGFMASAVLDSTLAHPGYGVDLAAQRQQQTAAGDNASTAGYFDTSWGQSSGTKVLATADNTVYSQYLKLINAAGNGGAGGAGSGGAAPVVVTLTGPRGTSDFRTGDAFTLRLTGSPNSDVVVSTWQNGAPQMQNVKIGKTDGSGVYVLPGTWNEANAGQWREVWTVNGVSTTISFVIVSPNTGTSGGGSTGGSTGGGSTGGSTGGPSGGSSGGSGGASSGSMSSIGDLLGGSLNIFGFSIPIWAAVAVPVVGVMAFGGRK